MVFSQKDINEIAKRKDVPPQEVASDILHLARLGYTKEEIEKMVNLLKGRSE